jgi:hypothetical protein
MQNLNNNIDQFIAEKASAYRANTEMMQTDFATIQHALPKGPTASNMLPKTKQNWFSLNNLLWFAVGSVVLGVTIWLATLQKQTKASKNTAPKTAKSNTVLTDTSKKLEFSSNDTPVVVYEIPKDAKTAPKKWVYRMQVNFDSHTNKTLPKKTYLPANVTESATKFDVATFYSYLDKLPEIFKIDCSKDQYITTKRGNRYFIQAGSFENIHNEPIKNNIVLEVSEQYKFSDIIAKRLHTNFNNTYIETEGIIHIQAYNDDLTVKQTMLKPIQAILKTKEVKKDVQLFNITSKGWLANGQFQNEEVNPNLKGVANKSGYYYFNIYQLNWINIGRTTNNEQTNLQIRLNGTQEAIEAYLLLPSKKICTAVVTNTNIVSFNNLPKNQECTLLILAKNSNKYQAYTFIVNTKNTTETIALNTPKTYAQVKATLDALGSVQ